MNKLMGFLELKEMSLPSVPWRQYTGEEEMSNDFLWTVRSAVYRGDDLNLPRSVGKNATESKAFADKLLNRLKDNGIVVFYPYFIAQKSGTLEVRSDSVIIEAVNEDLWNLVTHSNRDVTLIFRENKEIEYYGNENFLQKNEIEELLKNIPEIKKLFRGDLLEGKSALLEWSFAVSCNNKKEPINSPYLVFYEARTV